MMVWVGYVLLGLAAGIAHLTLLRWSTTLHARQGGLRRCVGLGTLRLALVAGLLVGVALRGAPPLLLTSLGLLVARAFALRPLASALP